ncbi:uncharacterized protein [Manis javanica]|uniref:uncharacterized protein n=1 Tax=Manis javanica TaxID=9974 RepID=UPI003C6D1520
MELQAANELLVLLKPKLERREKEIKVSSESQEQNLRGELPGPAGLVSRRRACPSPQAPPCQKPRSPGWRKGRAADITSAGPGIGTRHHRVQAARWACSPSPAVASGRRAGARPGGRVGPRAPSVTRHVRRGWGRCWPTFRPAGCSSRQPGPLAPPLPSAAPDGSGGPAGCSGRSGGLSSKIVASGKFIILHLHTCCPGISPQGLGSDPGWFVFLAPCAPGTMFCTKSSSLIWNSGFPGTKCNYTLTGVIPVEGAEGCGVDVEGPRPACLVHMLFHLGRAPLSHQRTSTVL